MPHPPGRHRAARHRAERPRRPHRPLAVVAGVVSTAVIGMGAVAATHGSETEGARDEPAASPVGPTTSAPAADLATPEAELAPELNGQDIEASGLEVPQSGPGEFLAAPVPDEVGDPVAGAIRFTVEVEKGLPFALARVAARVRKVLDDDRSWRGVSGQRFSQVASGQDLRILVASPDTTDNLCYPLQTAGEVSCRQGDLVILNAKRWAFGVDQYNGDLTAYRTYLVNHEVGHFLGHGHLSCTGEGDPAPVMMQQTYGLDECVANPWPTVA